MKGLKGNIIELSCFDGGTLAIKCIMEKVKSEQNCRKSIKTMNMRFKGRTIYSAWILWLKKKNNKGGTYSGMLEDSSVPSGAF